MRIAVPSNSIYDSPGGGERDAAVVGLPRQEDQPPLSSSSLTREHDREAKFKAAASKVRSNIDKLKTRLAVEVTELRRENFELKELQNDDSLQSQHSGMEFAMELVELSSKHSELQKSHKELQDKNDVLKEWIKHLQDQHRKEKAKLKRAYSKLEDENTSLLTSRAKSKTQFRDSGLLVDLSKRYSKMETTYRELRERNQKLEDERSKFTSREEERFEQELNPVPVSDDSDEEETKTASPRDNYSDNDYNDEAKSATPLVTMVRRSSSMSNRLRPWNKDCDERTKLTN